MKQATTESLAHSLIRSTSVRHIIGNYMLKISLAGIFALMASLSLSAQDTLRFSIDDCFQQAIAHYPNLKQQAFNNKISSLNIKNLQTNFYPKLNLNGQIHYQSDVTKVPIPDNPAFNIPDIAKDWYKINLDIEQMIYDGGLTAGQKEVEEADHAIADQKLQVELFGLKDRINQLFFNALFLKKNIEILQIMEDNLQANIQDATSAYENGMILGTDVDALRVEKSILNQQIMGLQDDVAALIAALNELCQLHIPSADALISPEIIINDYSHSNNRPEYILLHLQKEKVSALRSLTSKKRRPVLAAFGQAGYGRPGYDMLNNDFDNYYMIGARLHWNVWDWAKVKREQQILVLQQDIITSQEATFDQNLKANLHQRISDIHKYEQLIASDMQIVSLQEKVVHTAAAQLKNGTITSTTYLVEVNKQLNTLLKLEAHKLQLIFAKTQYMSAIGDL